jgi:hypothetical protein
MEKPSQQHTEFSAAHDDDVLFGLRRARKATSGHGDVPNNAPSAGHAPSSVPPRGVVYFSSVPTDMRPVEVRLEFERFGPVLRQRFVAAPTKTTGGAAATAALAGKRASGLSGPVSNRGLQFVEGWLEFADADHAREAALQMNSQAVFVRRRRRCHGESWHVKYLEGFQWGDLMSEREAARREERMEAFEERLKERKMNEQYRRLVAAKKKQQEAKTNQDDPNVEGKKKQPQKKEADTRTASRVSSTLTRPNAGLSHPNLWLTEA